MKNVKTSSLLFAACFFALVSCSTKTEQDDSKEVAEEQNEAKFDDTNLDDDTEFAVAAADGGMLEVQPYLVSVLADTAMRAADIDEAAALEAKAKAEKALAGKLTALDMARATAELAEVAAQIRAVQQLKRRASGQRN